jgi:hypothetical protein
MKSPGCTWTILNSDFTNKHSESKSPLNASFKPYSNNISSCLLFIFFRSHTMDGNCFRFKLKININWFSVPLRS